MLQELDLVAGEIAVGRSSSCQITLQDPLISRRHARFVVTPSGVTVEDLGSRNGVAVNGERLRGPRQLRDADRIRIGTHEMVFAELEGPPNSRRSLTPITGCRTRCHRCGFLFSQEADCCPDCGAPWREEEPTLVPGDGGVEGWDVELACQVLEKAVSLALWEEALKTLRRAHALWLGGISRGDRLSERTLMRLGVNAATVARATSDSEGLRWILALHSSEGIIPELALVEAIVTLPEPCVTRLSEVVSRLITMARASGVSSEQQRATLARLASAFGMVG
jgi:hypothetical protein